jgi:chemosensory pili system protein ChpA (sensor histidine kinase/response regulator)
VYLAHERIRVSEARSMNRAKILTARTDAAAEVAEVAAAEAAAAEAAAAESAAEAAAAVEAAAAAGAAAKAAADAPGAQAALAPELLKEPGGGAGGMAEDAEEIPGRPVFSVGARVRVLAATAPGIFSRLATGCGEAIVTAFDPRTLEYTIVNAHHVS